MSDIDQAALDFVKDMLGQHVPFAKHAGVTITSLTDGTAMATLVDEPFTKNHVNTQHAGALFTLAEAASGAALAGVMANVLTEMRPLVKSSTISYRKPAEGVITATASTSKPGSKARAEYATDGRTAFTIEVSMTNPAGDEVASMSVEWIVTS
jgi:uncharacterized protein (TIGR00369 family)